MSDTIFISLLSYVGYLLEAGLLAYLIYRRHTWRLWEVVFYLLTSLGVIGARSYTLHYYGLDSRQYGYCYWTTDLLLVLAAFVVVSAFFRRACSHNKKMWEQLRFLLITVLLLVMGVSLLSLSQHKSEIFTSFIIEFEQNLYFACLVLNTLLYLMVVKMEVADNRLGILVCGLGIQFAGPAACLAFLHLTSGAQLASFLTVFLLPLCDAGMTLTWFYAVARVPSVKLVPRSRVRAKAIFAEESVLHS